VLEAIAVIYHNDARGPRAKPVAEERLLFHQTESGPTMEDLHVWLGWQFEERWWNPTQHWAGPLPTCFGTGKELTLFLRVPGAPLDNNICEQVLKKAILHRKNALFYKTCRGAHVGTSS